MINKKQYFMVWPSIFIAIIFGAMTIKSGGDVLFADGQARIAAGNYVSFVLWFNFLAGFLYITAGLGLLLKKQWAEKLSVLIAAMTLAVFAAFGIHIFMDGSYEMRTVVAMTLRSVIWLTIAMVVVNNYKQKIQN